MLVLGSTVIGARDTLRATQFWSAALGLVAGQPKNDDGFTNLATESGRVLLSIQNSDQPAQEQPRLHLDLNAASADDQRAEINRLIGLGASTVEWDYPNGADFVVLADPDDNRFCVIDNSAAPEGFQLDMPR